MEDITFSMNANFIGKFAFEGTESRSMLPRFRKSVGILAYCLYHGGQPISRSTLIDLFWFDRGRQQGQASLRQSLLEIKNTLSEHSSILIADRLSVTLDVREIGFDLWQPDGSFILTKQGKFCEDLDAISDPFDEWVDQERRVISQQQLKQAEQWLTMTRRNSDEELAAAETVLFLDSWHEKAARIAMRNQAARGNKSLAIRIYQDLQRSLGEASLSVSATTRQEMERIRWDIGAHEVVPVRPVTRDTIPTIRLQPMKHSQGLGPFEHLCEVIMVELRSRLSEMKELRVIVTDSKEETGDYQLTATGVLAEESLKLTLEVCHMPSGEQIWSHRELINAGGQLYATTESVESTAGVILPLIERHVHEQGLPKDEEEWTAYQHYIRAKYLFLTASDPSVPRQAHEHYVKAIERDPTFLPPYPDLVASFNTGCHHSRPGSDLVVGRRKGFELANRYLKLDARNPDAHLSMCWCHINSREFAVAERWLRSAIDLGPYEAIRLNMVGTACVYLGEFDEGENYYQQASRRSLYDLDFQRTDFGELFYLRGDYQKALEYLRHPEIRGPHRSLFWRAAALAQLGLLDEAMREADALTRSLQGVWAGNEIFTANKAVAWFVETIPLRRQVDIDNLLEGLSKIGFT